MEQPTFAELLEVCWQKTEQAPLIDRLNFFQSEASCWNRFVFGNILDRKAHCRALLGGIQQRLCGDDSVYLRQLEWRLQRDLDEILLQEETLWKQ